MTPCVILKVSHVIQLISYLSQTLTYKSLNLHIASMKNGWKITTAQFDSVQTNQQHDFGETKLQMTRNLHQANLGIWYVPKDSSAHISVLMNCNISLAAFRSQVSLHMMMRMKVCCRIRRGAAPSPILWSFNSREKTQLVYGSVRLEWSSEIFSGSISPGETSINNQRSWIYEHVVLWLTSTLLKVSCRNPALKMETNQSVYCSLRTWLYILFTLRYIGYWSFSGIV